MSENLQICIVALALAILMRLFWRTVVQIFCLLVLFALLVGIWVFYQGVTHPTVRHGSIVATVARPVR